MEDRKNNIFTILRKGILLFGNVCFVVSLLVVFSANAGTTSVHENLIFPHSYFENQSWLRRSDTLSYSIHADYLSLSPVNSKMACADSQSVILFSVSSKRYFVSVKLLPRPTYLNFPKMKSEAPVETSIGAAGDIYTIFPASKSNLTTFFAAEPKNSGEVSIKKISLANFSVAGTETITLSNIPSGAEVRLLDGGPLLAGTNASCLWVGGTNGLLRFFPWTGSAWGSEVVYDIETSETITTVSYAVIGTASGKIYEKSNNKFSYKSKPVSKALRTISMAGAAGDDGVIVVHSGNKWNGYTKGSVNYVSANFIPRSDGTGAELLDNRGNYYLYTLSDSKTTFQATPSYINEKINSLDPYFFNGVKLEMTILLSDQDKNYKLPEVLLKGNILSDTLISIRPDASCKPGTMEMVDSTFVITIDGSTVTFQTKVRYAVFDPISYKYYWAYGNFQRSDNWSADDKLTIKNDDQTLNIVFGGQVTITVPNSTIDNRKTISYTRNNQGLQFLVPKNALQCIMIYSLSGRLLNSQTVFPDQRNILVPLRVSSGIVCIEYLWKNGVAKRKTAVFDR